MGKSISRPVTNYKTLSHNLESDIDELMASYSYWKSADICERLEVVYYDKIIKFHQSDLLETSTAVGIVPDNDFNREELCNRIIENYKLRAEILKIILDGISHGKNMIDRAKKGPICRNIDKFVSDPINCDTNKGIWITSASYGELLKKAHRDKRYSKWVEHFKNMEIKYKHYFYKLSKIFYKIKDNDENTLTQEQLVSIRDNCQVTVKKMSQIVEILFLLTTSVV